MINLSFPQRIRTHCCGAISLIAVMMLSACYRSLDSTSLKSTSPDGKYEIRLLEKGGQIDRNFAIVLFDTKKNTQQRIFESPDEGKPTGTERVIWEQGSAAFLLVGKNFFTNPTIRLESEEVCYFLYDIKHNESFCNASQTDATRISETLIKRYSWTEQIKF